MVTGVNLSVSPSLAHVQFTLPPLAETLMALPGPAGSLFDALLGAGAGEGAELRAPMAITVIAGLTTSTLLTLIVIPVIYALVSFDPRPASMDPAPGGAGTEGNPHA